MQHTIQPPSENDSLSNVQAFLFGKEPSPIEIPFETLEEYNQRMQWWKDAKYGMFIHWGLYSILAGEYKGQITPKIAEWIQNTLKIPLKDYKELMSKFNPKDFSPADWVKLAKDAGMKYLVITTKHHDGFALFSSHCSNYDINNTPYKKDIIIQLKNECKKQGLKFGVYYSHIIDWEHSQAYISEDPKLLERMNTVDYDPKKMNREIYLEEKALPQIKELLTNYGQIDIIWFDMGEGLTNNEVRKIIKITRELQPQIIINSRVGDLPQIENLYRDMLFDYYTTPDNYYTGQSLKMPWEMLGTTNGSWGYRKDDKEWRSASFIVQSLISSISRGGNYILNVGPDSLGIIPEEAANQLRIAGKWINKNQHAIYGSHSSPFPWNYDWGYVTQKPYKIFLHIIAEKPDNIYLSGIESKIKRVSILENNQTLNFKQEDKILYIDLPKITIDKLGYIIELDFDDEIPNIDTNIIQFKDNNIRLDRISGDYNNLEKIISWDFKINTPGEYKIELVSNEKGSHYKPNWVGAHQEGCLQVAGKIIPVKLKQDKIKINPTLFFYNEITSNIGNIYFDKVGTYTVHLKGFKIEPSKWTDGLGLDRILLSLIK